MRHPKTIAIITFSLLVLGASFLLRNALNGHRVEGTDRNHGATALRVVSLGPSVTETLFAIGCDEQVVGVTRYCNYPPAAKRKAKVGGYLDPSYEAITALLPDLVILYPEHEEARKILRRSGYRIMTVRYDSLESILESITTIGSACGREERAAELRNSLAERMAAVEKTRGNRPPPRVLVTAGRESGQGRIGEVFIAGRNNFYSQMLELAGGTNAYQGELPLPSVTPEGIIRMNPDIIVEMMGDSTDPQLTREEILGDWKSLSSVEAVKKDRIYLFTDPWDVIPGPRIFATLEKLSRVINLEQ